jgi:hypothetical protein
MRPSQESQSHLADLVSSDPSCGCWSRRSASSRNPTWLTWSPPTPVLDGIPMVVNQGVESQSHLADLVSSDPR